MTCDTGYAPAAISYLILGDLAVNTLRSMVSAQWQDKAAWSTSTLIASAAEGAKQARMPAPHFMQQPSDCRP